MEADYEMPWSFDMLPPVRDQGHWTSCFLHAALNMAEMVRMNNLAARRLPPGTGRKLQFSWEDFVLEYERQLQISLRAGAERDYTILGHQWHYHFNMVTALHLFLTIGVQATCSDWHGYQKVMISSFQSHGVLQFHDVQHYLSLRHPMMGAIPTRPDYSRLKDQAIYRLETARKSEDMTHAVMFFAYGRFQGNAYLLHQNSHGAGWCVGGVGRVYFQEVIQLAGTQYCFYTLGMDGVAVSVPPNAPALQHPLAVVNNFMWLSQIQIVGDQQSVLPSMPPPPGCGTLIRHMMTAAKETIDEIDSDRHEITETLMSSTSKNAVTAVTAVNDNKELPLCLANFGDLHWNEPCGPLAHLTRARRSQQDDAHIFCRESQLDFQLPVRFKLTCSGDDDAKLDKPVIIHREVLTSVERINGKWLLWLSPRRAIVFSGTSQALEYAEEVCDPQCTPDDAQFGMVSDLKKNMLKVHREVLCL